MDERKRLRGAGAGEPKTPPPVQTPPTRPTPRPEPLPPPKREVRRRKGGRPPTAQTLGYAPAGLAQQTKLVQPPGLPPTETEE